MKRKITSTLIKGNLAVSEQIVEYLTGNNGKQ